MSSESVRPLPFAVHEPYDGCDGKRMQYSVWDDDGNLVCECEGEDEGREEAILIATAVNRAGPRVCVGCGAPATCFGSYETELTPGYACDGCCGHGNENGCCEPVGEERLPLILSRVVAAVVPRGEKLKHPVDVVVREMAAELRRVRTVLRETAKRLRERSTPAQSEFSWALARLFEIAETGHSISIGCRHKDGSVCLDVDCGRAHAPVGWEPEERK